MISAHANRLLALLSLLTVFSLLAPLDRSASAQTAESIKPQPSCGGGSPPRTCTTPKIISTASAGQTALGGSAGSGNTVSVFNEKFGDQQSFDNYYTMESVTSQGSNSCYWAGSSQPQYPSITGGSWQVDVYSTTHLSPPANHNLWGYDGVGAGSTLIDYIRNNGPAHGISFPCSLKLYQTMSINSCSDNTFIPYSMNLLEFDISLASLVVNTRAGVQDRVSY